MELSQIIAEGEISQLKTIAELIVDTLPCKVITQPAPGMVMIKHVDPLEKDPFYLGEAFVTQCEVEIEGNLGYSCVLGNDSERALYGAIIDSVLGNSQIVSAKIIPLLKSEEENILARLTFENKKISQTRVNFDVKKG